MRVGLQPPDARSHQPFDPVGGFSVGVDIDGLVEVERAVRTPHEGVQDVVGVLRAEPGEDNPPRIGPAIPVGIAQVHHLGGVGHVSSATIVRQHRGGNQEVVGENDSLVRPPVSVGVFKDDDFIARPGTRHDVRIDRARRDPQSPPRIPVHVDRVLDHWLGSEQRDCEFRGNLQLPAFVLGVEGVNGAGGRRNRLRCQW